MRSFRPCVYAAVVAALFVGAHGVASGNPATEFLPLAAGKRWNYRELAAGQVTATEEWRVRTVDAGRYGVEIQTMRFDSLAKHDANGRAVPAVNQEYLIVDANGIARTEDTRTPQTGEYIIRNPITVGTAWGDDSNRCRITAVGVTDTLAGTPYENCVEVTCESGRPTAVSVISHFARGVGLVSQRVRASQELLSGALGTDVSGLTEERGAVESVLVLQNSVQGDSVAR